MPRFTYLHLINQTDRSLYFSARNHPVTANTQTHSFPNATLHPIPHAERLSTLHLFTAGSHTLSYLLPSVVSALRLANPDHWAITPTSVSLNGSTVEERSANMASTLDSWRKQQTFKVVSGSGWRNELYSVYSPSGELYFRMERSAAALFSVVTYGVGFFAVEQETCD
jgi:hypothetical protein